MPPYLRDYLSFEAYGYANVYEVPSLVRAPRCPRAKRAILQRHLQAASAGIRTILREDECEVSFEVREWFE